MIWFTSDLHLGDEKLLREKNRPFRDVAEMNEALVRNWNHEIQEEDTVYILGDISGSIPSDDADRILRTLKGKKHLILGNHDTESGGCRYDASLFEETAVYLAHEFPLWENSLTENMDPEAPSPAPRRITLILEHYPLLVWNHMRAGNIMLHGHIHSGPEYNEKMIQKKLRRFDVGVDANAYKPVALPTILEWAEKAGPWNDSAERYVQENT